MESAPTLGLAMLAQNDVTHVPVSIAQFYHVVSDIVVVDGGSIDGTSEHSARMGARVASRPFDYDFSAQRNYAISLLETDWIYMHDPDERLEPPLIGILPLLISPEGQRSLMAEGVLPESEELFDCFGFARKNFIDGVRTEIYPDYQYRLFRNYCKFEGKVHERITGFRNRTEVDFSCPPATKPSDNPTITDTERGQIYEELKLLDDPKTSRFNILHYKSAATQARQDALYRKLTEGV